MMKKWFSRQSSAPDSAEDGPVPAAGAHARRELLDRISTFLLEHDLEISPGNFSLLHVAFSGSDLDLAGKISARELAREPISQGWLDGLSRPGDGADGPSTNQQAEQQAELERLMARLETSIDAFTATAAHAHGTTSSYGNSLEEHVAQMNRDAATGAALTSFAGIARAMLERTRALEAEMHRSTEEAAALRRRLERTRRDAEIDHLTGLPNRRAFEAVLETQYREAQREIDALSVAFCDIDHFKRINDVHGHDAGDRVIQAIGEVLSRISDEKCHVARHGGEEFVMLFRGYTVAQALARLDEARVRLAERRFINRATDEPIGQITFSGGVANVFAYPDPRGALKAADNALYRAKHEGRNRICAA